MVYGHANLWTCFEPCLKVIISINSTGIFTRYLIYFELLVQNIIIAQKRVLDGTLFTRNF